MGLCGVSRKVEDVILLLYEKPLMRIEIARELSLGGGTVKRIVDWLVECGFAEEVPVSRYRVEVRLTEKGRRLAEKVRELQELLEGC